MEAAVGQLMPTRGDKLLVDATPSVTSTIACGGNSVVSSRPLSGVGGMATATSPEREGSSRTAKNTIGVASSPPVSSADAVETLLAAIAKYVHRRLLVPSAGDDAGTTQPSSIAKDRSMAKQLYSPAAGEASSTPSARADDSGDDMDEEHLITCAQQVEDHLLRCLLYVQLAPGGIPSQPELIGDYPSMPSAIALEKAGAEGSGAQIAAPHVVTSTRSTCANATGVEGEESPPPRHPSARRVADKYCAVESPEVRSRSWCSLSTPVGASSSAHARVSSSNAKAKELYYTYTRRGVPSSPPRQRGGAAAVGAVEEPHLAKKRHQSASRDSADVKAFASNSFALPPPEADSLDGALPAASGGFSALPPTRRGVVRPLHATEINAAMRSWPSRIAQYVLAATLAEKELRSAMEATDSSTNVRTPTKHECTSNDARTSSAHGGGTALNKETIFQVGESTEKGTDEEDVVIDAILRQLSDVLHHTPLSAGTGDTGAGQPPTIAFPSFARFYLADGGAGGILGGSGTDEHAPCQRVREEGNVHAYLARLAKVLLSTLDAGATRLAHQDNAISVEERLVLSGDIVTTIGVLLKRTPLITVPTYPSASPAGAPVLPMANNSAAATPVTTAKDAVWRALRSLLHLSPSSRYNPTMCTTPFVVGLVRRYTPGRKPRSDDNPDSSGGGGGGGTNLRVRLLPVADVFPRTDGAATAMAAPEADHELRGFQDGAHNLLRTPAFYTAAVLEVTGEDVLYSTTSHADAVSLEEEAAAKVRYETDVPEAYRDLYSRRMAAAQNGCGVYPSSATTLRGEGQGRKGGSEFSDNNAALAETSNALERATTLSALDRCLSRQECALWGKLLAIAQFVQVSGTPVEVETTARYVTLAIRHRRTARQRSECDSQQVDSPNVPVVSITESVSSPSVPAFFFTLTETSALRSAAAATAVEARRRLFCGARHDDDDDDDEDATLADATQGVRAESEGAQSSSAAGNQPCRFLGSTGLSLRGLLGWGKAAPLEGGSGQPTSSNIDVQHYESSNAIRAQPRRRGRGLHVRAALREPLAPTMQGKSTEELIMDWMHDVLIPLFFETTVSGGFVSQHGLTASAKSSKGNDGDDSEEKGGSAEAATAARKRAPYHLRSQRVLLGRVQAVTPSMVYGSRRITVARMEAVVRERAFDTDLLSYLFLNQLFFDPELSSADAVNVPVRRARSAPLPERTLHQRRSATDERQQTQEEGSRPRRLHTIRALSTLVTTAVSPHSPSLQTRRVSFREVDSGVTPQRLALPRLADDSGIQSQLLQQSPITRAAASAERQTSLAGSPRSILKSGRRYKREKLIRSSAPAASIVPFRNLFLWRWLVAEVLGRGDNGGRGVSRLQQEQQQQHQKEVGDTSAVSTTLCITAAGYLHHTQALAVRLASDVATGVLLSGLLAELYACSKEVRGDEHCHEGGSPVVTERDCGASRGEAAVVEGEGTAKKTPAGLITEEVRWRALSCDDLLPLANRAALAFVRAALAPLLCNPTDNPALPAGDSSRLIVDVDVCYVCDKEECRREWWCDDTHSEETSTGSHPGRSDKTEKSAPPHRSRLPGPSVVSLLCPDLSRAARHRLQTLSRLSLLHVRHEVLDSITQPLDAVLRRLTWALATHRLRALRQPLNDFLGRGDVIAVLRGSVGGARRVQAERQLWQHVHEVVVQCEECLLLPHLITNTGAPMWGTEPITLAEESETVVSEAAMNGDEEGDGKASARAPDEKVRWASLKKEAACPQHADNQESTTTLSVAADATAATEGGSGTSLSQLRVEQRETLVGGSAQRGGFKFVPLSFANVSVGPARPPSLSTAQVAVLQPRSSPSPLTCVPRGWNPPFLDTDDLKNLYSYPFDGRGLRLVSTAAQVDDRNSGVGDAASDFIKAAGSALGWQRSPLFGVGTRTDKTEPGAVISVVSRDGSVDDDNTSAASPDLRAHLASKSALDAARALPCCSSSDASCVIEAASPVRLFHSTTTTLDLPLPTVPKATEGGRLSGSPLILVDAHSTVAPQFASTATCSTPSGCDHSPPCADSSLSGTSHLRPQRAQVSSHRLSVLTLASAVPISRRLQVHTFGVCEMDGGSAEEGEQTPQKSSLASQQQQQQLPLPLPQSPVITPHRQSHPVAVRESAGARMMQTTKQAAGESPTSPEEGADAAVPTSKASGMSFVVQARGGAVVESSLLSPFVTEAKRVVAGVFLQRCVLPLWTRLIHIKEQEVGKGNAREGEGNTDTRDTMPARHEAEPQPLPRLGTRSGFSLSSPTAREAVSTASVSAAAAAASSKAESLLTRHVEKLTRENVELHRRLQDTNRLLADLRQTCCGLHMAAQQYELAVVLQRENAKGRGVVVAAATDFTDTSASLAGGGGDGDGDGGGRRTVPIPQHLNLASPSPLSSESHMASREGAVDMRESDGDATADDRRNSDASLFQSGSVFLVSPLAESMPPDTWYLRRTKEGCERVLELCQRMVARLSGTADPEDNKGEAAVCLPAPAVAYSSDLSPQHHSSASPLAKPDFFPLHFLSQRILSPRCPSPPEPMSAELGSPAKLCGEYSGLRGHSTVSHGPSQLFNPLEPQSFRRNSAAFTLVSLAPSGAVAMSSTIPAETPGSTQASTPIAVFFVGTASNPSIRSSPVSLSPKKTALQNMPPLSMTSQHPVALSFGNADVNLSRPLKAAYPAAALSFDLEEAAPSVQLYAIPPMEKSPPLIIEASDSHTSSADAQNKTKIPPSCAASSERVPEDSSSTPVQPSLELAAVLVSSSSSQTRHASPQPCTTAADDLVTGAHTPDDYHRHHRDALSSPSSAPSGHSSSSLPRPPSFPSSPSTAPFEKSSKLPFEDPNERGEDALVAAMATAHTSTPHAALIRDDDNCLQGRTILSTTVATAAVEAWCDGGLAAFPVDEDNMRVTAADGKRQLVRDERATAMAARCEQHTGRHIDVAQDTLRANSAGDLSELLAVQQQANEASHPQPSRCDNPFPLPSALLITPCRQLQYRESTSHTPSRPQESDPFVNTLPGRVSVGTQSSPQTPSSTFTQTLQHTWSDVPVHSVPPAIVADDGAERASHKSGDESSNSCVSPDQCIVSSDAIESNVAERPKPISTGAATPPRRLSVSLTQEGASGVGPAPAPLNAGERATSNLTATTVVSSSSSPFPCRTPARSSEAAVTALADLQQRLTGSNGAVVELHQQLKHVEEKLHEKEADIIRLTEKLAATEDALGALRRAATLEEAMRQQQQQQQGEQGRRLCTPSPPPPRVTAATSTEQLPFSPSASTTRWCEGGAEEEEEEEGDTHSVASTCHAATENPSQLKGCTAATVYSLVESPKPAAALASAPPLETPFLSTESPAAPSPPPPRVQLLRRVHELEGELRNANFRMDQWRALLDAERHARIVQVDQLTQQLESESRRCARASRSRSRSLSPLGSGAGPFSCVENLAGGEAEPRQLQAPLPAPAFPPPSLPPAAAAVMHPLTSMGGDLTLSPASPREQHETQLRERIDTLTGQLHSTEAHAAGERAQRLAADECIKVLEREQRMLRRRLEAQENVLQEALVQRRHHEQDADQRETALHREVESYRQTLATMQAAHAASNELQRSLMEELEAERRARAAEAAAHRIAQDRLAADSEEVQKRLRCERDDAILKQEEALAHAAIEIQAGNSRVAALQQRIDSMANELRTTDAESREQRQRCVVAETQAVALDLARQALLDRVMALEEDLSSARAAWKQWQQDTDERERVLRHEYGESAASAHAASETQRRANSELQQRYDAELHTLQCSKAASDEAHRTAFEEATRKLTDAEIANRQVAEELCREREDHERTDAALQKAQAENEALRRRIDIVSEKLRLVELPADPQRQQHMRISTLERELEEARTQQQDSLQQERDDFRTREKAFCRELETHAHTITALQKDKCAMEALQGRLEEVLHSEKLARAAEKAAHEAALTALQNQLSRAEQRALESIDALRREEDVHARTLAAFHATGEANRQLQLVRSAQEAHAEQCAQIWWSAREACAVKWMEAKTLLMVETFSLRRAELQLHEQQLQRRDVPSQPALLPVSLSSTGAGQHPEKSRKRKEGRSRSRSRRHRQSLPPDAVISVPTASAAPGLPPEMLVVSIDDPLGLCYELKCKTRHIASLKERVRQLEEAHCVDQQIVSTLQQLVAQEDLRNGSGLAAPSRVPPSAPSPTMATSLWPPRSPPQATSRGWPAPDLTPAGSSDATVTSHHRGVRMASGSSSPGGTTERRRMASNEYRQRYALL